MRDIIAIVLVGAVLTLGYFGHAVLAPVPVGYTDTDKASLSMAPEGRELVSKGLTIVNVQAGAKVMLYPAGDFVIQAPDGGVTVVQMPQPQSTQGTQRKHKTG